MDVLIRRARLADVSAVCQLVNLYAKHGKLLKRPSAEIKRNISTFFVAQRNGKIVGCVSLDVYSRKLAEIRSLAVSENESGKGIGKLLVSACVKECKARGVMELMAITSREKFFKEMGFDYTLPGERKAVFLKP